MKMHTLRIAAVVVAAVGALLPSVSSAGSSQDPGGSLATFEGRVIDLSRSWEGATACAVLDAGNRCFRTAEELYAYVDRQSGAHVEEGVLASCSTVLYLWDGTGKTGDVLALNSRYQNIPLAAYSFAYRTSSYQIGNCSAIFRDSSGSTYPGNTSAGASANYMVSGWNNRITTVYIS